MKNKRIVIAAMTLLIVMIGAAIYLSNYEELNPQGRYIIEVWKENEPSKTYNVSTYKISKGNLSFVTYPERKKVFTSDNFTIEGAKSNK